ncbi:hypothetical protein RYX36_024225, partial [Vicia faba]
ATTEPPSSTREYCKGNYTIKETLVLITAKKLDDERRLKNIKLPQPHHPHHKNPTYQQTLHVSPALQ